MFDRYKDSLSGISDFGELDRFLDKMNIPSRFREYAAVNDGIKCSDQEWKDTESYLLPQLRALVGRYSRLGEDAFYKLYLGVDTTVKKAIESE